MHNRPAKIEISEQDGTLRQVRFRQREIDRRKSLSLSGRGTADDDGVQGLHRLEVIHARAQRTEFFSGRFVRVIQVEQVRFRSRLEWRNQNFGEHAWVEIETNSRLRSETSVGLAATAIHGHDFRNYRLRLQWRRIQRSRI